MPHFKLPKGHADKGRVIVGGNYVFVDGKMSVSKQDAPLLERILCRFHDCTLVNDDEAAPATETTGAGSSLKAAVTKSDSSQTAVVKPATAEK